MYCSFGSATVFLNGALATSLKLLYMCKYGKNATSITCPTLMAGYWRPYIFMLRYTGYNLEVDFCQYSIEVANWKQSFQNYESHSLEYYPAGPQGLYVKVHKKLSALPVL
jgi:hypothetical protein